MIVTSLTGRYKIVFFDESVLYKGTHQDYLVWLRSAELWRVRFIYREYRIYGSQTLRWEQIR